MFHTSRIGRLAVLLLFSSLLIISCKDNLDNPENIIGSADDIRFMLSTEDIVQRVSVASDDFRIVTEGRAVITAPENSFVRADGSLYVGNIDFEVTEIYSKSDIIRYGISTMTADGMILVSEGEFKFAAFGDEEPLQLAPGIVLQVQVPSDSLISETQLFEAQGNLWVPVDSSNLRIVEYEVDENLWQIGYEAFVDELDWVNFDYFLGSDEAVTQVSTDLAEGITEENSLLFALFKNRNVVVEFGATESSDFSAFLPIGEEVYFVLLVAEQSDVFLYGQKMTTVQEGLRIDFDLENKSESAIISCLKALDL